MKPYVLMIALATLASSALAAPFENGDPVSGKALVEQHCMSCHASKFGGDGSSVYTRPNHKVRSVAQLKTQIAACNRGASTLFSEQQLLDVGAYLNQTFYKFQ